MGKGGDPMKPLVYSPGKVIIVRNYEKYKNKIDEFCRKYALPYEIHPDGSAVIVCD
jgi:hypothetical protein